MTPVCQPATETAPAPLAHRFSTRAQIMTAACGCAAASAFLFAVDPNRHAVYPRCLLYQTTGIYCAGCGATRALYALLHGHVLVALHNNLLFVCALPLLAWWGVPQLIRAWRINRWPEADIDSRTMAKFGVGTMVLMFTFMLVRNLPGTPFELLRPLVN